MRTLTAVAAALLTFISISCTTTNVGLYKSDGSSKTAEASSQASGDLDDVGIIDAHTHVDAVGTPDGADRLPRKTREEYIKEFQEAGVVAAVSHEWPDAGPEARTKVNDIKYIRCIGIGDKVNPRDIEQRLRSKTNRCIKIYLGYFYRYPSDKFYQPVYRLAAKYNVPVVYHTGDTFFSEAKVKYANPLGIDEVAVEHPKVKFVIAHAGNPWIESAAEVAYKNANVYVDVSAFMIGDMATMPSEKVETYVVKPIKWIFGYIDNPKKVMFGSDWPLANIKSYADAVKKAIPREHWRAVFHDNAKEVFGL